MINLNIFGAAALLAVSAYATPALAQTAYKYGDTTVVNAGPGGSPVFQLQTGGALGYTGLAQNPTPLTTLSAITQLSTDYQITAGGFSQGSPRFVLFDNNDNAAFVYFGTPALTDFNMGSFGNTGNYADLTSGDLRVESVGFGGYNSGTAPFVSFAQFVAQAGATQVSQIALVLDGPGQTLLANNFNLNGNILSAGGVTGAVPEPAAWLLMIVGFGAVGFAMRSAPKVRTNVRYANALNPLA